MKHYPNFLVIGSMKCATSSLHEQLALQPGIFMTELKEPNFFSDDEQYEQGIAWYESLFTPKSDDILFGESSTHYTKLPTYPQTIQRIQKHIPQASALKFIYVMRHPIDRLVSHYIHEWTQRVIPTKIDINQAISEYPELIAYSQYSTQLQPYFEQFGQESVLPLFFERLISHPQEELERVCEFLEYPHKAIWHTDLEAQNVSSARMRKSAWRDFLVEAPGLKTIRKTLVPKSFRERVKGFWQMNERPQLSAENLDYLSSILNQDLEILGKWLNLPSLSCENFKEIVNSQAIYETGDLVFK